MDDKRKEMLKRHPLSLMLDLKCKGLALLFLGIPEHLRVQPAVGAQGPASQRPLPKTRFWFCVSVYPHCFAWCLFFSPLCHTITTDTQRCLEKLHLFLNFKCHRHRSHTQIKLQEYAGFESFANTLNLISWTLGSAENVCFEIALVWIREHVVKHSAVGELAVKCEGLSRPDSQTLVLALTSRELW